MRCYRVAASLKSPKPGVAAAPVRPLHMAKSRGLIEGSRNGGQVVQMLHMVKSCGLIEVRDRARIDTAQVAYGGPH